MRTSLGLLVAIFFASKSSICAPVTNSTNADQVNSLLSNASTPAPPLPNITSTRPRSISIPLKCGDSFTLPVLVERATSDVFADVGRLSKVIAVAIKDACSRAPGMQPNLIGPKYISLDLGNTTAVTAVTKEILQLIECPTPVLSLLIPRSPGFQQLLTILDFFRIPVLTPFPLTDYDDHIRSPGLVSFSSPKSSEIAAILDLALLVGWTRLALIHSLQPEFVKLALELQTAALGRGVLIEVVKPLPIFVESGVQTSHSSSSSLKVDAISELAQELSHFYISLDFTIFVVLVGSESLGSVVLAIRQAGLLGLPGISFIGTDSIAEVFRSSTALLYGISEDDEEIGEELWWLGEQRLGSGVDSSVLNGWLFLSQAYRTGWEQVNHLLKKRLRENDLTSVSYIDGINLDRMNNRTILTNQQSVLSNSLRSNSRNVATSARISGHYEQLLYDIVLSIWHVMIQEYDLTTKHYICDGAETICSAGRSFSIDDVDLNIHFRSRSQPQIFDGIGGPIILNSLGTVAPAFTLFNIRNIPSVHGGREFSPVPIARWHASSSNGLGTSSLNPFQSTLSIKANRLKSILATLGASATLPGYSHSSWTQNKFNNRPPRDSITPDPSQAPTPDSINVPVSEPPELDIVEFPGGLTRIPKDCLFCRKGALSPPSMTCLVCEEDREHVLEIYVHIQQYNPSIFVGVGSPALSPNVDPDMTPLCDLWPGVLRCNSPWSYVLDLEGLELEGPLPHKIGHLKHVQELRFYRNLFNETIPSFSPFLCPEDKSNRTWKRAEQQKYVEAWPVLRQHVSKLKAVYFGKNQLEGSIPDDLKYCDHLQILNIKSNRLTGPLPDSICHLTDLIELDFSGNLINGQLPDCIGGRELEDAVNVTLADDLDLKNNDEEPVGLQNLQYFNGDDNRLSGSIPRGFGRLTRLILIALKSNALTGPIPDVWDSLPRNLLVDISQNPYLIPPLPASLARRLREDSSKVAVDPLLFGCPKGHRAPGREDWDEIWNSTRLSQDVDLTSFCRPCPKGSVPSSDSQTCKKCPPGTATPKVASSTCEKCPAGTFSNKGDYHCKPCDPGTYSYISGSLTCHPCPSNHFAEDIGSVVCLPCPPGASCLSAEQQKKPQALPGWFRIEPQEMKTRRISEVDFQYWGGITDRAIGKQSRHNNINPNITHGILENQKSAGIKHWDQRDLMGDRSISDFAHRRHLVPSLSVSEASGGGLIVAEGNQPMIKGVTQSDGDVENSTTEFDNIDAEIFKQKMTPIQRFTIFECPISSHCLGKNICSSNSYGPFCHRCLPYYTTTLASTECTPCRPLGLVLLRIFSVGPILFLVGFFVFRSFRKAGRSPARQKSSKWLQSFGSIEDNVGGHERRSWKTQAVILKVFTNWVELTAQALVMSVQAALVNEDGSQLSNRLEGIYNFIQNLDDPFFLFLPLDCLGPNIAPTPVHSGLILALICPLAILMTIYPYQFWKRWKTFIRSYSKSSDEPTPQLPAPVSSFDTSQTTSVEETKKSEIEEVIISPSYFVTDDKSEDDPNLLRTTIRNDTHFRRFKYLMTASWPSTVGVFIPIFFLMHPAITRQFLNNLECDPFDESRLARDAVLTCGHGDHVKFIYLAWAGLLVWTFGLPLVFGLMMRTHHNELHDPKVLLQWGFLLDGYEHRYYWWEVWAMLRKVLVDVPPVVPFLDDNLQLVALLTVAVVSLAAHVAAEPFDNRCFKIADRLESLVLWSFLLTLLTIPVHQTLTASQSGFANALSKIILAATVAVSAAFVGWAMLFYFRPLIIKLDESNRHKRRAKEGKSDDDTSSVMLQGRVLRSRQKSSAAESTSCEIFGNTTEWCYSVETTARVGSNITVERTVQAGSVELLESSMKCSLADECSNWSTQPTCSIETSSKLGLSVSMDNEEIPDRSSELNSTPQTSNSRPSQRRLLHSAWSFCRRYCRKGYKILRSFVLSPILRQLNCIARYIFLSSLSQRILHLEPRRVWIDADGILDMSELHRRDRRFMRQLILEDMLNALFTPNMKTFNTTILSSTLLAIFRRRAFQLEVQLTRERLKRLSNTKSTNHRWTNPFLLSSKKKLLSAVRVLKDSGLQRLQSVGGVLSMGRTTGLLSQESRLFSTRRSQQFETVIEKTSFRNTLGTIGLRRNSLNLIDSGVTTPVTEGSGYLNRIRRWRQRSGSFLSRGTENQSDPISEYTQEIVGPDIIFSDYQSQNDLLVVGTPPNHDERSGVDEFEHPDVFRRCSIERWRRSVLIIRCALALIRGLRDFQADLLEAATCIGLTIEELQSEVSRFNIHSGRLTNRRSS